MILAAIIVVIAVVKIDECRIILDHLSENVAVIHSAVRCIAAAVTNLPLNEAVKETLLVHVLPQCCCKVSWRHHLQDQLQELQGEAVSTCQRSSARRPERDLSD